MCRELDVPEEELFEIERGKPWERLSEMAYQGLCVWLDRAGKGATKAKLIKALRRCELKRAEGWSRRILMFVFDQHSVYANI